MLVKTVKYTDFNGVEKTKECHFHMSKREMLEMQASVKGGLDKFLKKMLAEKDEEGMTNFFLNLFIKAYGEKSEDGERFVKSAEKTDAFIESNACDALLEEILTSEDSILGFVNGVMPAKH